MKTAHGGVMLASFHGNTRAGGSLWRQRTLGHAEDTIVIGDTGWDVSA